MSEEIGNLRNKLSVIEIEIEIQIKQKYDEQFPQLDMEFTKCKFLADALSSSDFKLAVIKKNIDKLFTLTNEILSQITDFRLHVDMNADSVDISIYTNSDILPLGLASGFQKFISSIAIRLALTSGALKIFFLIGFL